VVTWCFGGTLFSTLYVGLADTNRQTHADRETDTQAENSLDEK